MTPAIGDVLDVTDAVILGIEPMGARNKWWISLDGLVMLFKVPRAPGALPEHGSDTWAEVLASAIAPLVGVHAPPVAFAQRGDVIGCVSLRHPRDILHGNELLEGSIAGYDGAHCSRQGGYTVQAISSALQSWHGWLPQHDAFDSFTGMLVFDALIGNTDRHHENWTLDSASRTLGPALDHGSSLGFNAPVRRRSDPAGYARRARSTPFAAHVAAVAHDALSRVAPDVRQHWMGLVHGLDLGLVSAMIDEIPGSLMTKDARAFVPQLMEAYREELLA